MTYTTPYISQCDDISHHIQIGVDKPINHPHTHKPKKNKNNVNTVQIWEGIMETLYTG